MRQDPETPRMFLTRLHGLKPEGRAALDRALRSGDLFLGKVPS